MERQKLYERFINLDWQQQLGNLASTLATISSRAIVEKHDLLTNHLLREAALMIEWCATNVPKEFLLELAGIQRELLAWQKVFPIEQARNILSLYTRNQSDRLLQMAGLIESIESLDSIEELANIATI
ncbi:hypothetical protein H6S82_00925 [Planktothrix sp. FACHB-1355]|uniref:Uncharacterized protein n=1 Tax=Aerosakkonema funiforme FACHB-1375 TaxID=2949571 RepID=A0A926VMI0_9CYAN|nr:MULTISPECIES: hypothetical protein [Oscillatoriales]MBD2185562.1 hypothetical protein [Aerosakkonema funiforme FACHB-1375]MBD3557432.1 hypothetical protein [Planktothrix sp. FACHB-1355]